MYHRIKEHIGHEIEVAQYGGEQSFPASILSTSIPWNVAIECVTCMVVIVSEDRPE